DMLLCFLTLFAVASAARVDLQPGRADTTSVVKKLGEKCDCSKMEYYEQTCCGEGLVCAKKRFGYSTCKLAVGSECSKDKECAGSGKPYHRQIACRAASNGKQRCCIRSISEAKNVLTEFRLGSAAAPLDNFGRDAGQNPFDASSCCSGFIEYGKGLGARCNDPNNLE
ncbi:unnamed protein product, partial [Symbiodinium pilosum]